MRTRFRRRIQTPRFRLLSVLRPTCGAFAIPSAGSAHPCPRRDCRLRRWRFFRPANPPTAMRDVHEGDKLVNRLEDAKAERLLMEVSKTA
jgi:hypothetical protein